LPVE
jgi:hypothetical protein